MLDIAHPVVPLAVALPGDWPVGLVDFAEQILQAKPSPLAAVAVAGVRSSPQTPPLGPLLASRLGWPRKGIFFIRLVLRLAWLGAAGGLIGCLGLTRLLATRLLHGLRPRATFWG